MTNRILNGMFISTITVLIVIGMKAYRDAKETIAYEEAARKVLSAKCEPYKMHYAKIDTDGALWGAVTEWKCPSGIIMRVDDL